MTKIDVIIVCWDYEVLKAKVVESKRHKTKGPQRSPILIIYKNTFPKLFGMFLFFILSLSWNDSVFEF